MNTELPDKNSVKYCNFKTDASGYDARGALGNMPSTPFDRVCYINATLIHE